MERALIVSSGCRITLTIKQNGAHKSRLATLARVSNNYKQASTATGYATITTDTTTHPRGCSEMAIYTTLVRSVGSGEQADERQSNKDEIRGV